MGELKFENPEFQELSKSELEEITGGFALGIFLITTIVVALAIGLN